MTSNAQDLTAEDVRRYLRSEGWGPIHPSDDNPDATPWAQLSRRMKVDLSDRPEQDLQRIADAERRFALEVAADVRRLRDEKEADELTARLKASRPLDYEAACANLDRIEALLLRTLGGPAYLHPGGRLAVTNAQGGVDSYRIRIEGPWENDPA